MIDINSLYNSQYFGERMSWKKDVYQIIADGIVTYFRPDELIDVGCGNGVLMECLAGRVDAFGIDGSFEAINICTDKGLNAVVFDLRQPVTNVLKFDLAVSIEVAEHLEEEFADIYVDTLCAFSDLIIFTASSVEDQYHPNPQPLQYWKEKFEEKGYIMVIQPEFLNYLVDNIEERRSYLYKNMMIFEKV